MTQNLKHFPEAALTPYGIRAEHPDEFLCHHLDSVSGLFCGAVNKVRARLKNPPYTVEEYLENLRRNGLVATVSELRQFGNLL